MYPQQEPGEGYNYVVLNQRKYFYQVTPFVLTNSLGFIRAHLKEYLITGPGGEQYRLYKTTERNWYDVENANPTAGSGLLRNLKIQIDDYENSGAG